MSCRLGRRSWGADLGEAGPQSREGAQNVGRTICDRSRKFGVEQASGSWRNGPITARCYRLFLLTRWGSFAQETARSEYYYSTVHCDLTIVGYFHGYFEYWFASHALGVSLPSLPSCCNGASRSCPKRPWHGFSKWPRPSQLRLNIAWRGRPPLGRSAPTAPHLQVSWAGALIGCFPTASRSSPEAAHRS